MTKEEKQNEEKQNEEKQYRLVKLHCGGTDLMGYINRGEDEPRTRHNTWNGWECPVLDKEQLLDFIKLQNWRIKGEDYVDDWNFIEQPDGTWGVAVTYSDGDEIQKFWSFNVETTDGKKIEVVDTPCYCFELGWGPQDETYNMEQYNKQFPHGMELHGVYRNGESLIDSGYKPTEDFMNMDVKELRQEILGSFELDYLEENGFIIKSNWNE